jgi:hypothetical protein
MQLETKAQISKATLSLLVVVTWLFLSGLVVLVLCVGFQVNPFQERTTGFLIAAFTGLIGVAAILVLLNVATNISLIADAKLSELKIETRPGALQKWLLAFLAFTVVAAGLIVGGTYLSKEKYLNVVERQANEVLKENGNLLEEIGRLLVSNKTEDYQRIHEILTFLRGQRQDFPQVTLIYSGQFGDKGALFVIGPYDYQEWNSRGYVARYYGCKQSVDCDYLKKFFAGQKTTVLQKYTMRDDQFYIYIPYSGKGARFVLLFERVNNYGKIGS